MVSDSLRIPVVVRLALFGKDQNHTVVVLSRRGYLRELHFRVGVVPLRT
jgi:hypothetical protein